MSQLMPLPLTVSCFSKFQIGFTFLVPAHLGSPGKGPLNGCVCLVLENWNCYSVIIYIFGRAMKLVNTDYGPSKNVIDSQLLFLLHSAIQAMRDPRSSLSLYQRSHQVQ